MKLTRILLALCAMLATPALAQSPAQWRYQIVDGVATATYPGKVDIQGTGLRLNNINARDKIYAGPISSDNATDNWIETLRPASTSISQGVFTNRGGFIGLLGGSRSSDSSCSGCAGTIGGEFIAWNNNATQVQSAWGSYIEAIREIGAGNTFGLEVDMRNRGALVPVFPGNMYAAGATRTLWLASGAEETTTAASVAIGIVANGSEFDKGIVFGNNAISSRPDGRYTAIGMGQNQALSWFNNTNILMGTVYGFGTGGNGSVVNLHFNPSDADGTGQAIFERADNSPIISISQSGLKLTQYTVSTLPSCSAARQGTMAYVTDAAAPAYNTTVAGGGAIRVPVFCNGTSWTSH